MIRLIRKRHDVGFALPLTRRDLEDLKRLREAVSAGDVPGTTLASGDSDEAAAHAVFITGLQAVQDALDEQAYAALAADDEFMAQHRRASRAFRPWVPSE